MGGNNGIGLGNNMPPIVNYPGVGNVGNVGGVQQGGALPNIAPAGGEALDTDSFNGAGGESYAPIPLTHRLGRMG